MFIKLLLVTLVIVVLFGIMLSLKSIVKKQEVKHSCSCGAGKGSCSSTQSCEN